MAPQGQNEHSFLCISAKRNNFILTHLSKSLGIKEIDHPKMLIHLLSLVSLQTRVTFLLLWNRKERF